MRFRIGAEPKILLRSTDNLATKAISIFAKPAEYWQRRRHLFRGSSLIRGDQIAEHIGAKLNPTCGYKNDVCIYVKPPGKPELYDYELHGTPYIDIVDGEGIIVYLLRHPEIPVIVNSIHDNEYLKSILKNEVVLIPQQHCNFDRERRTRQGIKTVATIGTPAGFAQFPEGIADKLKDRGLEWMMYDGFATRHDVVDFYHKIDVQVIWRTRKQPLVNALSTINAMSYGIPTIAFQEDVFDMELDGYYFPAKTLDDLLAQLDRFSTSESFYNETAEKISTKAEEYHIDNIGEMYKELARREN